MCCNFNPQRVKFALMKIRNKLIVTLCSLALVTLCATFWWHARAPKPLFRQVPFERLPGWHDGEFTTSLKTFKISCKSFMKQDPARQVGTEDIHLKVADWQPACKAALTMNEITKSDAKRFFQKWFAPVEFNNFQEKGLFTGYYMPLLQGSKKRTKTFNVPLYKTPKDLVTINLGLFLPHLKNQKIIGRLIDTKVIPYFTRKEINQGALKQNGKVLIWLKSPIDRLFLEIQGSGIVALPDGEQMVVGYDAQNGATYTSIAAVLIKKGVMTRDTASMQAIRHYLEDHPKKINKVINQNKSFVFFKTLHMKAAEGAQGVPLTPGYSMAVDKKWVPLGVPLWLNTTRPNSKNPEVNKPFQRLMIAQDTGGAIRGKVRGDVFWGGGDKATLIAGYMKNPGHYWLLLPRHVVTEMEK
jgi:membrane-bound lytic murein transglycosylase A